MPLSAFVFVLAVIAAVVFSPSVARRLRTPRPVAALLLFGFGFVIAATLTPDAEAMAGVVSDGMCDVSRIGLAPIEDLTRVSSVSLNVLLFIPLGLAVGLLPRTRTAAMVTIAAISLTFMVETIQLLATVLGRGCQTADIIDNLLGLSLGIALGTLARPLLGLASGSRT